MYFGRRDRCEVRVRKRRVRMEAREVRNLVRKKGNSKSKSKSNAVVTILL